MASRGRLVRCAAVVLGLAWAGPAAAVPPAAGPGQPARACPTLLNHRIDRLQDEQSQDLCQYRGKVVLVVNTASYCGFTPQYKGLEALQQRYGGRGLVVLGFPSNDFGAQEPGSNQQIAEFCENTFSVRFPMFVKTSVAGRGTPAHPLYEQLAQRTGQRPAWNFHKYLIGRDGQTVVSHPSRVDPLDPIVLRDVEKLLDAK